MKSLMEHEGGGGRKLARSPALSPCPTALLMNQELEADLRPLILDIADGG